MGYAYVAGDTSVAMSVHIMSAYHVRTPVAMLAHVSHVGILSALLASLMHPLRTFSNEIGLEMSLTNAVN